MVDMFDSVQTCPDISPFQGHTVVLVQDAVPHNYGERGEKDQGNKVGVASNGWHPTCVHSNVVVSSIVPLF